MKSLSKIGLSLGVFLLFSFIFKIDALAANYTIYPSTGGSYSSTTLPDSGHWSAYNPDNESFECSDSYTGTVDVCVANGQAYNNKCCTSSGGCTADNGAPLSIWDFNYASGCIATKNPFEGTCAYSFAYQTQNCGVGDRCLDPSIGNVTGQTGGGAGSGYNAEGKILAGSCDETKYNPDIGPSSACVAGGWYKTCCQSDGTAPVTACQSGGCTNYTAPPGKITCDSLAPTSPPDPTPTTAPPATCSFSGTTSLCGYDSEVDILCPGNTYPNNNTIVVSEYACIDSSTEYSCANSGAIPGQCGNPIPTSTPAPVTGGPCTPNDLINGSLSVPSGNTTSPVTVSGSYWNNRCANFTADLNQSKLMVDCTDVWDCPNQYPLTAIGGGSFSGSLTLSPGPHKVSAHIEGYCPQWGTNAVAALPPGELNCNRNFTVVAPTPTPTPVPASAIPAISAHCINNPNVGNEETIYWTNVPGFTADYIDISTNTGFSPYYNRGVARQPNSFVSVFAPGFAPQNFTRMPNQSPPLSLSPNTTYYVRLYDSNTGRHSPADGSPASSYPSFNQPACPIPSATPAPGQAFLSAFSSCSAQQGNRPVINLSWNNITGNTGYLINKCSGPNCTNQTPAQITRPQNVTDYTDGPFGFNATYTYNVIACLSGTLSNCTRWGNYSNYATSTTPATCSGPGATITPTPTPTATPGPAPTGAPNPPTVTPYCGGLSATLTISKPTGTSYYQVTINGTLVSPNLPALSDPTIPSYNTTRGSSNTCGVTACNASNLCSASTPCNFTCPNTIPPWIFVDGDVHSNTRIRMSE